MSRANIFVIAAAALVGVAAWSWWAGGFPEERQIRRRIAEFAEEFNNESGHGLAAMARAARLGQFFTDDVIVELGKGSPPIVGRETLMGMAARLQPRTAAFILTFEDVTVETLEEVRAAIGLTAVLRRRHVASGEESLDAREFTVELARGEGDWQIRRVVAVDTLR